MSFPSQPLKKETKAVQDELGRPGRGADKPPAGSYVPRLVMRPASCFRSGPARPTLAAPGRSWPPSGVPTTSHGRLWPLPSACPARVFSPRGPRCPCSLAVTCSGIRLGMPPGWLKQYKCVLIVLEARIPGSRSGGVSSPRGRDRGPAPGCCPGRWPLLAAPGAPS